MASLMGMDTSSNGEQPVTLHDLDVWGGRLTERINTLGEGVAGLEERVGRLEMTVATKDDLQTFKQEIIAEFKVVAENMHADFVGATKDKLQLLDDHEQDHEKRIQQIEERLQVRR